MTMPKIIDISDGCPRCGDEVMLQTRGLQCRTPSCAAVWPSYKNYESECIARDLAGTRKKASDSKSVDADELQRYLEELVRAVRYATLKEVRLGVSSAIVGRKALTEAGQIEIAVLQKMHDWIRELAESDE